MPKYKTHARVNILFALPLLLVGAWGMLHPPKEILLTFGATFTYCTLFLNPDLDLAHTVKLFSLRGLLTLPFRLYSRIFSHRGISHSPLFGSLTRILYLFLLALIFIPFASHETILGFITTHKAYFIAGGAGLFLADLCHIALDKVVS